MAFTQSPLAGTATGNVSYADAKVHVHISAPAEIGDPFVAVSGDSTGNGQFLIFAAATPCIVLQSTMTVIQVGTGAASGITVRLVSANNGANVSQNVALGNVITTGLNVSGNVYTTGPYSYNVFANGVNSGSNTAKGGVLMNIGDYLVATHNGNTLYCACATEYVPQGPYLAPGAL